VGPSIIFDKSALQSLSVDESVWLDRFFMGNITPLFYVETLADLEKKVRAPPRRAGLVRHQHLGVAAIKATARPAEGQTWSASTSSR
jgi:hypothetical protein